MGRAIDDLEVEAVALGPGRHAQPVAGRVKVGEGTVGRVRPADEPRVARDVVDGLILLPSNMLFV